MKGLRLVFSALQSISPAAAAWLAERLFFTPPRQRSELPPGIQALLARARRFEL